MSPRASLGMLCVVSLVLLFRSSSAVVASEVFALVGAIRGPADRVASQFGVSAVQSGSSIIVGAARDNSLGAESGAVYWFRDGTQSPQQITQPDSLAKTNFGFSLAATESGDVVVGNYPLGTDSGVYVFDSSGGLKRRLSSPTSAVYQFGIGLATIGNTILVGSLRDSTAAFEAGAIYAYEPGVDEPRIFVSSQPSKQALLGRSITPLGESKFVASAYTESGSAFATGAAYIFDLNGNEVVRIADPNPRAYNYFGIGTGTLDGNVLIGVAEQEGSVATGGTAYMFDQQGNLLQQFHNPHPNVDDLFGYKLEGIGDYVVVGAPSDGTTGRLAGAAYVFDQQGNLIQELHDPTPGDAARFGLVQSFGDTLVIGAPYDGGGNVDGPGAVYIYKLNLLPGDVNMDSRVNLDDFISLRKHFGQDVNARADGDLTGDLKVDLADFIQLRANFGKVAPVPEPGGVALTLLTAGLAWMGLRGRAQKPLKRFCACLLMV